MLPSPFTERIDATALARMRLLTARLTAIVL